jgi:heat shock protein HslJ
MRLVLMSALFAAACASAPAASSLAGTHWTLAGSAAERPPTLDFTDTGAAGFAGCNQWFATLRQEAGALRFESIGSTRMACEGPRMEVERSFLAALERARNARRDGDTLVLLDEAGGEAARFIAAR